MGRIKDYLTKKPKKDDVIVFDGEGGTFKIPLGDFAGVLDCKGIAGFHNSIYRGANLKERWGISDDKAIANEVCRRIADGSFDDLFVGDYWSATISSAYGTETVEIVLAGFDVYMNCFGNDLTQHHAVVVTRDCLKTTHRMNASHTTSGGFGECEMFTTTLPKYAAALQTSLSGHILTFDEYHSCNVDDTLTNANYEGMSGATDDWSEYSTTLSLLSEQELYGCSVWTSSGYDVCQAKSQLPLFRLNPGMIQAKRQGSRQWYWLKNVASSTTFCGCNGGGGAGYGSAGFSYGVRPRFLIG